MMEDEWDGLSPTSPQELFELSLKLQKDLSGIQVNLSNFQQRLSVNMMSLASFEPAAKSVGKSEKKREIAKSPKTPTGKTESVKMPRRSVKLVPENSSDSCIVRKAGRKPKWFDVWKDQDEKNSWELFKKLSISKQKEIQSDIMTFLEEEAKNKESKEEELDDPEAPGKEEEKLTDTDDKEPEKLTDTDDKEPEKSDKVPEDDN